MPVNVSRYSTFADHFFHGAPVMRPILTLTPEDEECYKIDYEYLLGIFFFL